MSIRIRDMTGSELGMFADVIHDLSMQDFAEDPRHMCAERILHLMRADTLGSYVWDAKRKRYDSPVTVNHDANNVRAYLNRFQFNDPLTTKMRSRRRATLVEEVFPMSSLCKTAFYQDFLKPDNMYHGINIFHKTGQNKIIDLRVWRCKSRPAFEAREIDLLNILARFLGNAYASQKTSVVEELNLLTPREREIAQYVSRGCTDRDIAQMLGISFSTVRTHVNSCFDKFGCANRAELSARCAATLSRQN